MTQAPPLTCRPASPTSRPLLPSPPEADLQEAVVLGRPHRGADHHRRGCRRGRWQQLNIFAAGGDAGATDAVETTEAAPAPEQADDPLSDGDWTASDIQLENSQFGTSLTASVTNDGDDSLSGLFTVTVFNAGGARIGNFQGSASNVEPGSESTVTFIGTTDALEGDPATSTYEFEDKGSY